MDSCEHYCAVSESLTLIFVPAVVGRRLSAAVLASGNKDCMKLLLVQCAKSIRSLKSKSLFLSQNPSALYPTYCVSCIKKALYISSVVLENEFAGTHATLKVGMISKRFHHF